VYFVACKHDLETEETIEPWNNKHPLLGGLGADYSRELRTTNHIVVLMRFDLTLGECSLGFMALLTSAHEIGPVTLGDDKGGLRHISRRVAE
jgi:hypothetical protein